MPSFHQDEKTGVFDDVEQSDTFADPLCDLCPCLCMRVWLVAIGNLPLLALEVGGDHPQGEQQLYNLLTYFIPNTDLLCSFQHLCPPAIQDMATQV